METHKLLLGLIVLTSLLILGGIISFTKQYQHSNAPLMGQEVIITSRKHISIGVKIIYNSKPPAGGPHYPQTAHAGIYTKAPLDGYLMHSLEHGAVILWFDSKLPK